MQDVKCRMWDERQREANDVPCRRAKRLSPLAAIWRTPGSTWAYACASAFPNNMHIYGTEQKVPTAPTFQSSLSTRNFRSISIPTANLLHRFRLFSENYWLPQQQLNNSIFSRTNTRTYSSCSFQSTQKATSSFDVLQQTYWISCLQTIRLFSTIFTNHLLFLRDNWDLKVRLSFWWFYWAITIIK